MIVSDLFLLMWIYFVNGSTESGCCYTKKVGENLYTLFDEKDTSEYMCKSDCVYKKVSEPGSRYCFKAGGSSAASCIHKHAPIKTSLTISEGDETIVQKNSFHNDSGILTMTVPAHKDYTESVSMLHQDSKTSMLKTGNTCQLTDLPDNRNVSVIAAGFEAHNKARIKEPDKVTTFKIQIRESRLGSGKRAELVSDHQHLCQDVPMVKTNDFEVNKKEFEKFNKGEVITRTKRRNSRYCEEKESCVIEKVNSAYPNCVYWPNPLGEGLTFHDVGVIGKCVTCNIWDGSGDVCGVTEYGLCKCEDIKTVDKLKNCHLYEKPEAETVSQQGGGPKIVQSMRYDMHHSAGALTVHNPADNDSEALEVLMHGYEDGYLLSRVSSGSLKNNYMLKVGNFCHILNLPDHVFPTDIALGIHEIEAGNDVTTEDDEEDKHTILLDDGFLTLGERDALHPEINSLCSNSYIQKSVETPVTKSQGEELKKGKIVFVKSNSSRSNCELQTAVRTNHGSGSWRWPNPEGSKLWIHQIVHPVVNVSCCVNHQRATSPTCCADNYRDFCPCQDLTDKQTFNQCSAVGSNSPGFCPTDWSPHGSSCYRLFTTTLTWNQAQAECQKQNSNLASVFDGGISTFIGSLQKNRNVWIGAKRQGSDPKVGWKWLSNNPWQYQNWGPGEPNGASELCAEQFGATYSHTWNDKKCSDTLAYVCSTNNVESTEVTVIAEGWLVGYCLDSNGQDQNSGVITLSGPTAEQCLAACRNHNGATGCELIKNQGNQGCYVHTEDVASGSQHSNHICYLF